MTTYTADDFKHAHFAMHSVTGSVASKGRMDWKWVLPGWYDTGDVSRLSDQQMADAGWAPVRVPAGSYTRTDEEDWQARAVKAEQALVEMTAHRDQCRDTAIKWQVEANRAVQPRALTPDAITDEMVERGARQYIEEDYTSWERSPALAKNNARESVRGILEAALTEPTRPEGAEEIEAMIRRHRTSHPGDEWDKLADHLASEGLLPPLTDKTNPERGVRVVTEDGAR